MQAGSDEQDDARPRELWFWLSSVLLFMAIFFTNSRLLGFLGLGPTIVVLGAPLATIRELIAPIRGLIFLCVLAMLARPLWTDVRSERMRQLIWPTPWTALVCCLALAALLIPEGLKGIGQEYGSQSLLLFEKASSVAAYQRFLMPALGYITFMRGGLFFFAFSFLCVFVLVYLTHTWLVNSGVRLPWWGFLSIITSSFVAGQYQLPGYPDTLVFVFFLLVAAFPLRNITKFSLLALSLATHEASLVLYLVFLAFVFHNRTLVKSYALMAVYGAIWLASEGFNLTALLSNRPQTSSTVSMSTLDWLTRNPWREVLGILFAYKLLWLLLAWSLVILLKKKGTSTGLQIGGLLAGSLVMTLLAVDTSRLMGWSFFALLLAVKTISDEDRLVSNKILRWILLANLAVPSVYVGLNVGMVLPGGLYAQLLHFKNWAISFLG